MPATILSPHPDDAALSLWHLLAGPDDVAVVNVFAGEPPEGELRWWDELSGASDRRSRAAERLAEDREALGLVGREPTNLGFVDLQYREDELDAETIADAIADAAPSGPLLAPASVAEDHPDHTLVRDAALLLRERGREVSLYADLPHASRNPLPDWRLSLNGGGVPEELQPEVRTLKPAEEARKRELCERYRTQIAALDDMFELVEHPERLRYEVVWPLP
jgi:LmbE family N-acetylglucosaminyl deacetylase